MKWSTLNEQSLIFKYVTTSSCIVIRKKYNSKQLDEKLTKTFKKLFQDNRYDTNKIHSLADMLSLARYLGVNAKRKYLAIENLLAAAEISEIQMRTNDVWTFALYQTLRHLESQDYNKQHIYTSVAGKTNANTVIKKLNALLPDWLDATGKIRSPVTL